MSIPEYLFYPTVTSSSNSNYTIVNTEKCKNKHFNNSFQSDSDSYTENSKLNNMKRNTIPPNTYHTTLYNKWYYILGQYTFYIRKLKQLQK